MTTPTLPAQVSTVVLTGTFLDEEGNPWAGRQITISSPVGGINVGSADTIIVPKTRTITLDANGHMAAAVIAPADPDLNPSGWNWIIKELFGARREYAVPITGTPATVDLADIAPADFYNGTPVIRGKSAYEIALEEGYTGTQAQWLTSIGASSNQGYFGPPAVSGDIYSVPIISPWGLSDENRTNLVKNPRAVGSTSWTGTPGTGGAAAASSPTNVTDHPVGITTAHRRTWSGATTAPSGSVLFDGRLAAALPILVTPTASYTASIYARPSKAQTLQAAINFYDDSGTLLLSTTGPNVGVGAAAWQRLSVTEVAPAGATRATVAAQVPAGGTNWAPGDWLDGTGALLEQATTLKPYFDGALADGTVNAWAGVPNASNSTKTAGAYFDPNGADPSEAAILGWNSRGELVLRRTGTLADPYYMPAVLDAASDAAMLALPAKQGDFARRTDQNQTYILKTNDPTVLANWVGLIGNVDATIAAVNAATALATASTLVRRDANGASALNWVSMPDQTSAPTAPTSGGNLYKSNDHGVYLVGATATRRLSAHWGTGTAFPTTALAGDTFLRSNVAGGALFRFDGTNWRLAEDIAVADVTARDAIPTAVRYMGMRVWVTSQMQYHEWDATNSLWRGTVPLTYGFTSSAVVFTNSTATVYQVVLNGLMADPGIPWYADCYWRQEGVTNAGRLNLDFYNSTDNVEFAFRYFASTANVYDMAILAAQSTTLTGSKRIQFRIQPSQAATWSTTTFGLAAWVHVRPVRLSSINMAV